MPNGEPERGPSQWSVEALRAHIDQRLTDVYRAMDERDLRYEQRFRAQQEALQAKAQQNAERITDVAERQRHELASINQRLDVASGKWMGIEKSWGYVVGAAGVITAIVAVIYAVSG